jgi:hypothetical protein
MTIHVFRYPGALGDTPTVTTYPSTIAFLRDRGYVEEIQAAPTDDELVAVESIKEWLLQNYERGAHWIYETRETAEHVVLLREMGMEAYRADMQRNWETLEDYSQDIRNS